MLNQQQSRPESSKKPCTESVRTAYRIRTQGHRKQAQLWRFSPVCVLNLYRYSAPLCTDPVPLIKYTKGTALKRAIQ